MRSGTKLQPLRLLAGRARRPLPQPDRDRYGPLFDIDYYLSQVDGAHPKDAVRHYEDIGAQQGLSPSPLFWDSYYRRQHQGEEIENPVLHYRELGSTSGCRPHPLFDPNWYQNVAFTHAEHASIAQWDSDLLSHYLDHGWHQGLSPHPLVYLPYASGFVPRLRRNRIDPLSYLIQKGLSKFRRPHPLYSPDQLWTCLKRNGTPITQEYHLLHFTDWCEPYSPSPFFWVDFYLIDKLFA